MGNGVSSEGLRDIIGRLLDLVLRSGSHGWPDIRVWREIQEEAKKLDSVLVR